MTTKRFDRAVQQHQDRVYSLASYLLSDRAEAEDVTQEVLIKLWHNRQLWRSEKLRAWLLRVTRNACFDRLRTRRSRARFLCDDPQGLAAATVPSADSSPEDRVADNEFMLQLKAELEQLAEPVRSALVLREIQGLSYREIAEVLELSLSNVRVTLHRGRRLLRERLKGARQNAAVC